MTGVAAHFCGNAAEVSELGLSVDNDGVIKTPDGQVVSKIGSRRAILNDLSPAATFIASVYNGSINADLFRLEAQRLFDELEKECGWMYETRHTDGRVARIDYVVWSESFSCPNCGGEVIFVEEAYDEEDESVRDVFPCRSCAALLSKQKMQLNYTSYYDSLAKVTLRKPKRVPVKIAYSIGGSKFTKVPSREDLLVLKKIEEMPLPRMRHFT